MAVERATIFLIEPNLLFSLDFGFEYSILPSQTAYLNTIPRSVFTLHIQVIGNLEATPDYGIM